MRLIALLMAVLALLAAPLAAQDGGRLIEYERIPATGLPDQRLTIWLPPGYDADARRYPVLYMHDGHNLFDVTKSNFNKIWAADKAMLAAVASGAVVLEVSRSGEAGGAVSVGFATSPGSATARASAPRRRSRPTPRRTGSGAG